MFKFAVLTLLLPLAIASPLIQPRFITKSSGKIVGGLPIPIEDAPYQVSLQTKSGFHFCGGSVISPNFILTAAHCTEGNAAKYIMVRAGSDMTKSGGVLVGVQKIHQHEKYNNQLIDFDYSLLQLAQPLNFSKSIQPIGLPDQDDPVEDGTMCLVSGWGNTQNAAESREKLRAAYVPSYSQEDCQNSYVQYGGVTDRMICAGYKKGTVDSCQGS